MKPFLWQDINMHLVLGSIIVILYLTQVVSEFKIPVRKISIRVYRIHSIRVIIGERKQYVLSR